MLFFSRAQKRDVLHTKIKDRPTRDEVGSRKQGLRCRKEMEKIQKDRESRREGREAREKLIFHKGKSTDNTQNGAARRWKERI